MFKTIVERLKPGVRVVAEMFPRFGATDYSSEVTRLLATKPDVVFNASWGGDLDTFFYACSRLFWKTLGGVMQVNTGKLVRVINKDALRIRAHFNFVRYLHKDWPLLYLILDDVVCYLRSICCCAGLFAFYIYYQWMNLPVVIQRR